MSSRTSGASVGICHPVLRARRRSSGAVPRVDRAAPRADRAAPRANRAAPAAKRLAEYANRRAPSGRRSDTMCRRCVHLMSDEPVRTATPSSTDLQGSTQSIPPSRSAVARRHDSYCHIARTDRRARRKPRSASSHNLPARPHVRRPIRHQRPSDSHVETHRSHLPPCRSPLHPPHSHEEMSHHALAVDHLDSGGQS
ncbi:MAG: hypothetical protein JWN53_1240 [Gemmatimonadetes bacterium]|nr:hypothetical protein [Gemmatimonadota bacterium]